MGAMAGDEAIVYQHISLVGNEGIWTKTLKAKTNLHMTVMNRCLKALEQRQLVKAVKNVKYPTRKTYMLFGLKPSVELTGGPWFNDNELDVGFIEGLLQAVYTFIEKKVLWPTSRTDKYPSLSDIRRFIHTSGLTEVKLEEEHVQSLLEVLVFDGKVESLPGAGGVYRALRRESYASGLTEVPCGLCEVFDFCAPKGPVNARDCTYYDEWLL
ncbi:RNA polymerase Rpc34, partial [Calocera cornea HHB12733]